MPDVTVAALKSSIARENDPDAVMLWQSEIIGLLEAEIAQLKSGVRIPTSLDEATMMAILSTNWLLEHAPEKLRDQTAEAVRKTVQRCIELIEQGPDSRSSALAIERIRREFP